MHAHTTNDSDVKSVLEILGDPHAVNTHTHSHTSAHFTHAHAYGENGGVEFIVSAPTNLNGKQSIVQAGREQTRRRRRTAVRVFAPVSVHFGACE